MEERATATVTRDIERARKIYSTGKSNAGQSLH
jgi:hypothetical protein